MRTWVLFFILVVGPISARAANLKGTVFEMGSQHTKPLFQWQREETAEANRLNITLTYTALDQTRTVTEKILLQNGKLETYNIDHQQTGEKGSLTVKNGKLLFEYTKDGKTKTAEEDLPENLVVTATLTDFLAAHGEKLLAGETVHARLGVLDRRETVGFKFFKVDEGMLDGKPTVTIKMKPTSFIIAAIVDPLHLTFAKDKMRILEIKGRTMPKKNVDGHWKDLDAETVYTW